MMYPEILEMSNEQLSYFRTSDFSELMMDSERLLKKLLKASESSKVTFLTASGTGAMEAAVACTFDSNDRLLIIVGGNFGHRFCEICDVYRIPYDKVELGFDEELKNSQLEKFAETQYSGLLVNADETSTGQLYDLKMLSAFCKKKNMYLIVDAISSSSQMKSMDFLGIDVLKDAGKKRYQSDEQSVIS